VPPGYGRAPDGFRICTSSLNIFKGTLLTTSGR
jgi:hypothetical protein